MQNYFTLFGLSLHYFIDTDALRSRYLTLQEHIHPDKSLGKTTALTAETLNHAYQTLNSPFERAEHLLVCLEIVIPKIPSADILRQTLQQREELEEAVTPQTLAALAATHANAEEILAKKMQQAFARNDTATAANLVIEWRYTRKWGTEIRQRRRKILLGQ